MLIQKNPPTEKQIAASRANGRKSRGPISPAGKLNSAAASANRHLLTRTIVFEGESADKFEELLDFLYQELRPESPIEIQLVESIAVARWRQMRIWGFEKTTIAVQLAKAPSDDESPVCHSVRAFKSLLEESAWSEQMSRHELRYDRQYSRSMRLFREHREWRRQEMKNIPVDPVI